jgi:hypothetical protein
MRAPGRLLRAGERLCGFQSVWRRFRASPEIVELVQRGHGIEFYNGKRPKLCKGADLKKETKLPAEQMKVIRKEIAELRAKGALRMLSSKEAREKPGYYSRMFCVSKPCGAWRPIINLKPMNRFVVKKKFRLETIRDVKKAMRVGQWAATIDLKDAYYHISIKRTSRKYLRFIIDGIVYEFKALPMGYTASPRIFTRLTKFLTTFFRRHGVIVIMYIDE